MRSLIKAISAVFRGARPETQRWSHPCALIARLSVLAEGKGMGGGATGGIGALSPIGEEKKTTQLLCLDANDCVSLVAAALSPPHPVNE